MQIASKKRARFDRDAPEAQKCRKKQKTIKMGPHGVVSAIVGCDLGKNKRCESHGRRDIIQR